MGLFCNYKEIKTSANFIGSLLEQLALQQSEISDEMRTLHRTCLDRNCRPSLPEYSTLLQAETRRLSKVFVVFDALDECAVETRERLLVELKSLGSKLYLMITSRPSIPIMDITSHFQHAVELPICASSADIEKYLEERLKSEPKLRRHINDEPPLRKQIISAVIKNAQGMSVSISDIID